MIEQVLTSLGYADGSANAVWHFVLLTLVLGGGAAWRTGQAVAQNWGELWPVVAYTALLAAGIRFLHFALFGGLLLSFPSYLIDFVLLAVIAIVGYRARRARHMTEQYGWMFERSGPLSWRDRS